MSAAIDLLRIALGNGPGVSHEATRLLSAAIGSDDGLFCAIVSQITREQLNWLWRDMERQIPPEDLAARQSAMSKRLRFVLGIPQDISGVLDPARFPKLSILPRPVELGHNLRWRLGAEIHIPAGNLELIGRAADGGLSWELHREIFDFQAYSLSGSGLWGVAGYHLLAKWDESDTTLGTYTMTVWLKPES